MERDVVSIRHFKTQMNESGRYMGREFDPPIIKTDLPDNDPRLKLLRNIINLESVVFYSSPAVRCSQTLETFKDKLGLFRAYVHYDERFLETDFGEAVGLTAREIKRKVSRDCLCLES